MWNNKLKAGFVDGLDSIDLANRPEIKEKYKNGFIKGMEDSKNSGRILGYLE